MIRQFLLNQKENVTCPMTFNTRHSTVTHDAEVVDGKSWNFRAASFELQITFQFYYCCSAFCCDGERDNHDCQVHFEAINLTS